MPGVRSPLWSWTAVVPVVALAALALAWGRMLPPIAVVIISALHGSAVLAAVHHAEVIPCISI